MPTNALLCRYSLTWHEVEDAGSILADGRREAWLSLGALQSSAEVDRVGGAQLDLFARPREEITAHMVPTLGDDQPWVHFHPGDLVSVPDADLVPGSERCVAVAYAEDEHGNASFVPSLKDLVLEEQERLDLALRKMAPGTMAGRASVATRATPVV